MRSSVNTIICDTRDRFLLQMRDGNPGICHPLKWNFFGGGLEPGETSVGGAARETAEELGVAVSDLDFSILGSVRDEVQEVWVVRLMRPLDPQHIVLNEGAGFGYFRVEDIARIDATPMTLAIVERFLSGQSAGMA